MSSPPVILCHHALSIFMALITCHIHACACILLIDYDLPCLTRLENQVCHLASMRRKEILREAAWKSWQTELGHPAWNCQPPDFLSNEDIKKPQCLATSVRYFVHTAKSISMDTPHFTEEETESLMNDVAKEPSLPSPLLFSPLTCLLLPDTITSR